MCRQHTEVHYSIKMLQHFSKNSSQPLIVRHAHKTAKCDYQLCHVCLFPIEQLGFYRTDLHKIWYSVKKIEVSLNQTRIHGSWCTFMTISHWILGRMRKVEKIKIYILRSIIFSWKSCHLWDVGKYGRVGHATGDNIIWCMCFACQITKATDTHSEYVILIAFPRQQWLCEYASTLCYMNIAHLVVCHFIFTE
jgi:hypothetical protein